MGTQEFVLLFQNLVPYKSLIILCMVAVSLIIFTILTSVIIRRIQTFQAKNKIIIEKEGLKNSEFSDVIEDKKGFLERLIASPDGVNPLPLSYTIVSDGGKEFYVRSFTIDKMPKNTTFANTFSALMDFNDCTASVFIHKLTEAETIHKMDRHIVTLEAEFMTADDKGDTNRKRTLSSQYADTEAWVSEVEVGENTFFEVGFLFTIRSHSLSSLNRLSDSFHSIALEKSIEVTSCYGVQPEAFQSNVPMVHAFALKVGPIKTPSIKYHWMDKRSLSTIFNHTQADFSHKKGIILGRNMLTGRPVTYNVYDPSHDGYTILICGKTGCGKSATIKIMAERYHALEKYRFVAIDSQPRGAVGEYAGLAEVLNGVNFLIKAGTNNIMNIFEVAETTKLVTEGTQGHEVRTLELASKIAEVTNTVLTMIQGQKKMDQFSMIKYVERKVTDIISDLYADFGIIDAQADSLYREGVEFSQGSLTAGRVRKALPTISDFYKKTLIYAKANDNKEMDTIFNIILFSLKDFVRELYYSEDTLTFFTKDELEEFPREENSAFRIYKHGGLIERVVTVVGIRSYFDGQSTVAISKECPFTNLDISQLPDSEKVLARQIAIDFVNENFVKKNSESVNKADPMAVIFDEAHENFVYEYARRTIDNAVRTARKRHVSIWLSTQSLAEYDRYEETKSILRNAAAKFIYKQDYQDKEYLMRTLNLTESQVDYVLSLGGNPADASEKNTRRGEVCIVDTSKVCFCKVQYLKDTEGFSVETAAEEVKKIFSVV